MRSTANNAGEICNSFGTAIVTMQQLMWQGDLVQVAHFVSEWFAVLETSGGE